MPRRLKPRSAVRAAALRAVAALDTGTHTGRRETAHPRSAGARLQALHRAHRALTTWCETDPSSVPAAALRSEVRDELHAAQAWWAAQQDRRPRPKPPERYAGTGARCPATGPETGHRCVLADTRGAHARDVHRTRTGEHPDHTWSITPAEIRRWNVAYLTACYRLVHPPTTSPETTR